MTCFFFLIPGTRFWASDSIKLTQNPLPYMLTCYPVGHHAEIGCFCVFPFVYLIVCLCLTSLQQLSHIETGPQLKFSSDRLVKLEIKHTTPGYQSEEYSCSFVLMNLRSYYKKITDGYDGGNVVIIGTSVSPYQLQHDFRS